MLQKELNKLMDLENLSLNADALVDGKSSKEIFCQHWESAKKVLTALQTIIKNPIVRIILGAILALGDGFQKKHCMGN